MFRIPSAVRSVVYGALVGIAAGAPVLADDLEIYQSQPSVGARPNVLFIIDTSASMDGDVEVTPAPYEPDTEYTGSCSANRIYYSTNDTPPSCSTSNYIERSAFVCKAAQEALKNIGGSGMWPGLGNSRAQAAQYRSSQWRSLSNSSHSDYVECRADDGVHGQTDNSNAKYIANGTNGGPWSTTNRNLWSNNLGGTYRFFTGNYLNYIASRGPTSMTRLQIVRDVAIALAGSLQNVNLGLMRYSSNSEGGYILEPVRDINTNRAQIISTLQSFDPKSGDSYTPLSETYYEAALYMLGRTWDFGSNSQPQKSAPGSRVYVNGQPTSTYKSPIEYSCQKNYIVYLTDGAPTKDVSANQKIEALTGKSCSDPTHPEVEPPHDTGWEAGSGVCMDELAAWMAEGDVKADLPGNQTIQTYMIGFGSSVAASVPYLDAIARAGGTNRAYTAADVPTLTEALQQIFSDLQEDSGTFVTPSVSVNAFNRTEAQNDLFYTVFRASKTPHWPGNLKKYKLVDGKILDKNNQPAVDVSGFFSDNAHSIWSAEKDGANVALGGAASRLPAPDQRKIYTSIAGVDLTAPGNAVTVSNMTDALVGAGSATDSCGAACQRAVNWARGKDVDDVDKDGDTDEPYRFMGDPIHGRPAVVAYGRTTSTPAENDSVVFVPTNDGFLHAIEAPTGTTNAGRELWAYIPPELLPRLSTLASPIAGPHTYGLDGDIRVLRVDKNGNGIIEPGTDYVYLFFGMRAGGNRYYALDVTNRTAPKLLWSIGPEVLPDVGQTWSPPEITRVSVSGKNTDPDKYVLIFGGGYDVQQESQPYSEDTVGNRIYMVEAKTGKLLWSAGRTTAPGTPAPDLKLDQMTNSIPARITVIDLNGDGFADRMYAGDMGGRLWRFDIYNGQPPDKLVTGGVIAKLGAGGVPNATAADNRRFYNAPDVSLYENRTIGPFFNIAIGSGYRGHPLDTTTIDRFYVIRDKQPYARYTQQQYNSITPLLDSSTSLIDITADPAGSKVTVDDAGWKLSMTRNGAGEKVLGESTTANNVVMFPTFQPSTQSVDPCYPATVNRVYALSIFDGKPVINYNDTGTSKDKLDNDDLFTDLQQGGIAGEVNVIFKPDEEPSTVCLAGIRVLNRCVDAGGTVRTFWYRTDAP
jgi:type IV pilus assembly protein PilY1